jgi:hypothetical protein
MHDSKTFKICTAHAHVPLLIFHFHETVLSLYKQSNPWTQLLRAELLNWQQARSAYSNYVKTGHRNNGKQTDSKGHLAWAFGSALSTALPSAAISQSTSRTDLSPPHRLSGLSCRK